MFDLLSTNQSNFEFNHTKKVLNGMMGVVSNQQKLELTNKLRQKLNVKNKLFSINNHYWFLFLEIANQLAETEVDYKLLNKISANNGYLVSGVDHVRLVEWSVKIHLFLLSNEELPMELIDAALNHNKSFMEEIAGAGWKLLEQPNVDIEEFKIILHKFIYFLSGNKSFVVL